MLVNLGEVDIQEWIKNEQNVYIGRRTKQLEASKWANPFRITSRNSRVRVVDQFEQYLRNNTKLLKEIPAAVPCVFSDQIGRGRTTNAMVLQFCKHLFHSKDTHRFSCNMFPSIIETHLKPEGDCLSHKRNTDHDGA